MGILCDLYVVGIEARGEAARTEETTTSRPTETGGYCWAYALHLLVCNVLLTSDLNSRRKSLTISGKAIQVLTSFMIIANRGVERSG